MCRQIQNIRNRRLQHANQNVPQRAAQANQNVPQRRAQVNQNIPQRRAQVNQNVVIPVVQLRRNRNIHNINIQNVQLRRNPRRAARQQVPQNQQNIPQRAQQRQNIPYVVQQRRNIHQRVQQRQNIPHVVQQRQNIPQRAQQRQNVPQRRPQRQIVQQIQNYEHFLNVLNIAFPDNQKTNKQHAQRLRTRHKKLGRPQNKNWIIESKDVLFRQIDPMKSSKDQYASIIKYLSASGKGNIDEYTQYKHKMESGITKSKKRLRKPGLSEIQAQEWFNLDSLKNTYAHRKQNLRSKKDKQKTSLIGMFGSSTTDSNK